MSNSAGMSARHWVLAGLLAVIVLAGGTYGAVHWLYSDSGDDEPIVLTDPTANKPPMVRIVYPRPGAMDRTTTQPGSVMAWETVDLRSAVSGFLKKLNVDIGSKVKANEVLAIIEVPELDKQLMHDKAAVEQAEAKVQQMRARKDAAEADLEASKAAVKRARSAADSAHAWVKFRELQWHRMESLFKSRSIDERNVDEAKSNYEATLESARAAEEAIVSAQAHEVAAAAKIVQTKADIDEAQASVKVAEAEMGKTKEMLNFATIVSPFDGVITRRTVFERDFIRAASAGNVPVPLLTVEKTDKMRIVVQLPHRDIPFADVGDEAIFEVDGIQGPPLKGAISRLANSADPQTRLMPIEIDMPNPTGKIYSGMYGNVTITLQKSANVLALPFSSVVNIKDNKTKGQVYVVRGGRAWLTGVTIVGEHGNEFGVIGLKETDQVIANPGILPDGATVTVASKKK
jgi:RND family efflux transporter MFP subunit